MAPLSTAIKSKLAYVRQDETHVYKGEVDQDWCIGSVAHGGYVLSLILYALLAHQRETSHPDPAHLTAEFLSATTPGSFEVHLRVFSASKRWTRIDASLYQATAKDRDHPVLRVKTHFQFTALPGLAPPVPPSADSVTVMPHTPSSFATPCPLIKRPDQCQESKMFSGFKGAKWVKWAEKQGLTEAEGTKMEWGAWMEFKDDADDVTSSAACLPFFADMFRNGVELLPKDQQPGSSWYPTLSFSMDILARFPLQPTPTASSDSRSAPIAPRTVGLFTKSRFLNQGRHDNTVEVWSAPSAIGAKILAGDKELIEGDAWRKQVQILAVSTQLALTLDFAINKKKEGSHSPSHL